MSPRSAKAVAIAVALLALPVGCGGSDDEGSSDPTPVPPAETTTTDAVPGSGAGGSAEPGTEDGAGSGPGDEEQVEAAIEALLTDPDNGFVCNEILTPELLATSYGDLQGCLKGRAEQTLGDSVRSIDSLEIEGDRATAEAVVRGGLYGGEPLEIVAVRDGGGWRIDRFTADVPVGP